MSQKESAVTFSCLIKCSFYVSELHSFNKSSCGDLSLLSQLKGHFLGELFPLYQMKLPSDNHPLTVKMFYKEIILFVLIVIHLYIYSVPLYIRV